MSGEQVVLVDEAGNPVGVEEKLAAHQGGGKLHLAFSVFVFNGGGELLLQRRAADKYHFGGLWSNTCCGHPCPGENVVAAGERRLREELGFTTKLEPLLTFAYEAADAKSGLTEREVLNVLVGRCDAKPAPDPTEVEGWRWCGLEELRRRLEEAPDEYTPWLRLVLERWPPDPPRAPRVPPDAHGSGAP
ncbi:MAG: isopentenyl-diphosphate Delta-isomerase [Planctomycetota bacterium]|nr:isopentenyl-diphosphate Delta-isomerase [Planctomycetota bacterium]